LHVGYGHCRAVTWSYYAQAPSQCQTIRARPIDRREPAAGGRRPGRSAEPRRLPRIVCGRRLDRVFRQSISRPATRMARYFSRGTDSGCPS
jgi:hypothetical protein